MEDRLIKLDSLEAEWRKCERCDLAAGRTRVVMWRGSPKGRIALIGEAPGRDEDAKGLPFVGAVGMCLDELARRAGISMVDEAFVINAVGCRPPKARPPERDEMRACKPRIEAMLGIVQPKVIVLLGPSAATIAGILDFDKWRGVVTEVEMLIGGKVITWPVIATTHPSSCVKNIGATLDLREQIVGDLKKAREIACG